MDSKYVELYNDGSIYDSPFFKKCYMEIPLRELSILTKMNKKTLVERAVGLGVEIYPEIIVEHCGICVPCRNFSCGYLFAYQSVVNKDRYDVGFYSSEGFEPYLFDFTAEEVLTEFKHAGVPEDILRRERQKGQVLAWKKIKTWISKLLGCLEVSRKSTRRR